MLYKYSLSTIYSLSFLFFFFLFSLCLRALLLPAFSDLSFRSRWVIVNIFEFILIQVRYSPQPDTSSSMANDMIGRTLRVGLLCLDLDFLRAFLCFWMHSDARVCGGKMLRCQNALIPNPQPNPWDQNLELRLPHLFLRHQTGTLEERLHKTLSNFGKSANWYVQIIFDGMFAWKMGWQVEGSTWLESECMFTIYCSRHRHASYLKEKT